MYWTVTSHLGLKHTKASWIVIVLSSTILYPIIPGFDQQLIIRCCDKRGYIGLERKISFIIVYHRIIQSYFYDMIHHSMSLSLIMSIVMALCKISIATCMSIASYQ